MSKATAFTVPSGGLPKGLPEITHFSSGDSNAGHWDSLLGGPRAFSKRGCFHCQAKIKIILVSSLIFDSNDAEFVTKSHPRFCLLMRAALIAFQIYGLQKQGRNGEGVDADFSTASEFRQGKQDADSRGARGSSWVSFVF